MGCGCASYPRGIRAPWAPVPHSIPRLMKPKERVLMSKNPRLIRAVRSIERRMFLKAMALGLSVPAAMRLARAPPPPPARRRSASSCSTCPTARRPSTTPRRSTGDDLDQNFTLEPDQRQHPGPAAAVQAVRERLPGISVSRARGDARGASSNCLSGYARPDRHDTTPRTTVEQVIGKALRHQAADPGRLFPPDRTAWTRTACCSGTARRSIPQKSPVAARGRAVRRDRRLAAAQRRRAAAPGPAGASPPPRSRRPAAAR